MARRNETFSAIITEGGLLPADLLQALLSPRGEIEGSDPRSYHLAVGEKIADQVNRSWNRLQGCWQNYRKAIAAKTAGEPMTTETRERWLYPLFQELGFGRLAAGRPVQIDGHENPISHAWESVPIHLLGSHVDLDRRTPGAVGAARMSPHSMLQQALNNSDGMLWGLVSNGHTLRLLRDNVALSRQTLVEFDLETIFEGDLYGEFLLLWMVCHQSRFEGERPESCWLEKWKKFAEDTGLRALENLRPGVEAAITALGSGFVAHRANVELRQKLSSGALSTQDLYQQVLRVVYRMLFLFVTEDRGLLHPGDDSEAARKARKRYAYFYSLGRLRSVRLNRAGTPHPDLWNAFRLVSQKLGSAAGCPELALPPLGSFLWSGESTPDLDGCLIPNRNFLEAIHALAFVRDGNVRRTVDYRDLGAEELGSVYEGLLELHPVVNADAGTFELNVTAGNARKTTGSYYTPDSLVQCLLDSALEPVMDHAVKGKSGDDAAKAILDLKVCDPAVGSGHFLIAAAHRMAKRIAAIRSGEEEPSPTAVRGALRQVVGRCLYGVDINPMAAELCKVSLWLEALEPGKPLSFLDHHIRVGNSLLGATPELIAKGIPDEAFKPIEGDDKKACSELKKINARERKGLGDLFADEDLRVNEAIRQAAQAVDTMPDDTPEAIASKTKAFEQAEANYATQIAKTVADTWCAAFVVHKLFPEGEKHPFGITQRLIQDAAAGHGLPDPIREAVHEMASQYRFFHWNLAFPEVFSKGGFDCVLGNPPWDTLSPDQREFFGKWVRGLRSMSPEDQEAQIATLLADTGIAAAWSAHCRSLFSLVHFLKNSGVFTLYAPGNLGKGDFNIYRMFVEVALRRSREGGFAALVVPGGLYGGANASAIRRHLLNECELRHVYGLINTQRGWFEHVDIDRFAAFAAKRGGRTGRFMVQFGLARSEDLAKSPVELDAEIIRGLAPETYAIPDVRDVGQLATNHKMYAACPAFGLLIPGTPHRHYQRELDMGNDRDLFTEDPRGLPVYEGRMIDAFDHRAKTYQSGHGNSAVWIERPFGDPQKAIVPQWRVLPENIPDKLGDRCDQYRIGFGDVANPRNERSFVATLIPPGVICGHKVPTIVFEGDHDWAYLPWLAVANSFAMDWLARSRLTAPTMSYTLLDSLPFPRPVFTDSLVQKTAPIVLRLVCTAPDMMVFWNQMAKFGLIHRASEDEASPGLADPWDRARRRAELDAFVAARVFDLTSQELSDVLDTFPVLARRDEKQHGEFLTKRLILTAFKAGAEFGVLSAPQRPPEPSAASVPPPTWMDEALVLPRAARVALSPERYRAALVPQLLYQAGGRIPFDRFRRAYWLLTEPNTLQRFALGELGSVARDWARAFCDTLRKEEFLAHLKGAVEHQLHFVRIKGERWLELRDLNVTNDVHVIFDARMALIAADLWPSAEPIVPFSPAEETIIEELEGIA